MCCSAVRSRAVARGSGLRTTPVISRLDNEACPAIRVRAVVPAQQPTRGPSTDAVDFAAFTPIAAWVRTRDGEPALRMMCAAAGIDPHLFAGSGGSLPLAITGKLVGRDRGEYPL